MVRKSCPGRIRAWQQSFMSHRENVFLVLKVQISSSHTSIAVYSADSDTCGVPQGSILGNMPFFFIAHVAHVIFFQETHFHPVLFWWYPDLLDLFGLECLIYFWLFGQSSETEGVFRNSLKFVDARRLVSDLWAGVALWFCHILFSTIRCKENHLAPNSSPKEIDSIAEIEESIKDKVDTFSEMEAFLPKKNGYHLHHTDSLCSLALKYWHMCVIMTISLSVLDYTSVLF